MNSVSRLSKYLWIIVKVLKWPHIANTKLPTERKVYQFHLLLYRQPTNQYIHNFYRYCCTYCSCLSCSQQKRVLLNLNLNFHENLTSTASEIYSELQYFKNKLPENSKEHVKWNRLGQICTKSTLNLRPCSHSEVK